jgi:DNA-directed RNA polymerase specialized sigma24 family protein
MTVDRKTEIAAAKQREVEARRAADDAAADYRREVRSAVAAWRLDGLSIRKCADRIGISEGALRDLLRPEGASRRAPKKKVVRIEE